MTGDTLTSHSSRLTFSRQPLKTLIRFQHQQRVPEGLGPITVFSDVPSHRPEETALPRHRLGLHSSPTAAKEAPREAERRAASRTHRHCWGLLPAQGFCLVCVPQHQLLIVFMKTCDFKRHNIFNGTNCLVFNTVYNTTRNKAVSCHSL